MHRKSMYGKSWTQKARARVEYRARQLRRAQRAAAGDMETRRPGRWSIWSVLVAVWRGIVNAMRESVRKESC